MYCTNCGKEVSEGMAFCPNCGKEVSSSDNNNMLNVERKTKDSEMECEMNSTEQCSDNSDKFSMSQAVSEKKSMSGLIKIAVIVGILLFVVNSLFFSKKAECKTAEKTVKSVVFENYGEVPDVESKCIYDGGKKVIIVVRFKLPKLGYGGSYAVVVSDVNSFVHDMTKELDYSFDYDSILEEMKTYYRLD